MSSATHRVHLTPRARMRRGFTLVELLVVVAIIALLIAILLPAIGRARAEAEKIVCQTNQRQLHQAFSIFTTENSGYSPPFSVAVGSYNPPSTTDWTPPFWSWHDFLAVHLIPEFASDMEHAIIKPVNQWSYQGPNVYGPIVHPWFPSTQLRYRQGTVMSCPSAFEHEEMLANPEEKGSVHYSPIAGGMPGYRPQIDQSEERDLALKWQRLDQPAEKILFIDAGGPWTGDWHPNTGRWHGPGSYGPGSVTSAVVNVSGGYLHNGLFLADRHLAGSNMVYVDGHTESVANIYEPNDKFYGDWWHRTASYGW